MAKISKPGPRNWQNHMVMSCKILCVCAIQLRHDLGKGRHGDVLDHVIFSFAKNMILMETRKTQAKKWSFPRPCLA